MHHFRTRLFLFLFTLVSLTLAGCEKEYDDGEWHELKPLSLTTGSWRLDEIRQIGANSSSTSGENIKDRYTLTFRNDGTYQQKLMADGTTFNGTWMLMSNNTVLYLTDHKGSDSNYKLESLTASELRYSYETPNFLMVERIFSAQP